MDHFCAGLYLSHGRHRPQQPLNMTKSSFNFTRFAAIISRKYPISPSTTHVTCAGPRRCSAGGLIPFTALVTFTRRPLIAA
jgi:hypothetical protein